MSSEEARIVPSFEEGEGTMAEFLCDGCEHTKAIEFRNYKPGDILRGVVLCSACGEQTFFEMKGTVLSFIPGKYLIIPPSPNVPQDSREKFTEAKLCYFAAALRATAVMQRASLESALNEKGFTKGTLEERIDNALANGDIKKREYTLAHGTRLIGNESIHQAKDINPAEVQPIFGALTQILNKLFE